MKPIQICSTANGDEAIKPRLRSIRHTASALGLGQTTVWGLVKSRELDAVRIRRRTLVTEESIDQFIGRLKLKAAQMPLA